MSAVRVVEGNNSQSQNQGTGRRAEPQQTQTTLQNNQPSTHLISSTLEVEAN